MSEALTRQKDQQVSKGELDDADEKAAVDDAADPQIERRPHDVDGDVELHRIAEEDRHDEHEKTNVKDGAGRHVERDRALNAVSVLDVAANAENRVERNDDRHSDVQNAEFLIESLRRLHHGTNWQDQADSLKIIQIV